MERLSDENREILGDHAWKAHLMQSALETVSTDNDTLRHQVDDGSRRFFAMKVRVTKLIAEMEKTVLEQWKKDQMEMERNVQLAEKVLEEKKKANEMQSTVEKVLREIPEWKELREEYENMEPIPDYNALFEDFERRLQYLSEALITAAINRGKQYEAWALGLFAANKLKLQSYKARLDDRRLMLKMFADRRWPLKAGAIEDNECLLVFVRTLAVQYEEAKKQWMKDMGKWKMSPKMLTMPKIPRLPELKPLEGLDVILDLPFLTRSSATASGIGGFSAPTDNGSCAPVVTDGNIQQEISQNNTSEVDPRYPIDEMAQSSPESPDVSIKVPSDVSTGSSQSLSPTPSKSMSWGEKLILSAPSRTESPKPSDAWDAGSDKKAVTGENGSIAPSLRSWASLDNRSRVTLFFDVLQKQYDVKKDAAIPILLQLKEKRKNLKNVDHVNLLRYVVEEAKKFKPIIQRGKKRMYNLNRAVPSPAPTVSVEDLNIVFRELKRQWAQITVGPAKSSYEGTKPVEEECVICMCQLGADNVTKTECGHWYHAECLREWTGKFNRSCPLCRNVVLSRQEFPALNGV